MTAPEPAYAVGDEVVVTTRDTWHGRPLHDRTGHVVTVVGPDAPRPIYGCDLDGTATEVPLAEVPLTADEIARADEGDACRD